MPFEVCIYMSVMLFFLSLVLSILGGIVAIKIINLFKRWP